ncbi:MAG TPA: helix-turn-helix domain-containing protein [Chitinophagales bacterium]|nr:helix-turn-helix domain-containing protein [Chitinophagales bacterium]
MSEVTIRTVAVGVLLPFEYNLYQIAILLDILKSTNQYCYQQGLNFQFEVEIVQTQGQINENSNAFFNFPVTNTLTEKAYELVFIPPMDSNDISDILDKNKVFKDWILDQHEEQAIIYAFANANVLLAYAGLLDEQKITSIGVEEEFFQFFTSVQKGTIAPFQKINQIVLSEGNNQIFYTLFQLIHEYIDYSTILYLSKKYLVPLLPPEIKYFYDFQWVYESGDHQIDLVLEKIHGQYSTIRCLDEVLEEYSDSRRHFNRKFLQLVKMTPLEYLQNIRIAHAKFLLINGTLSIEEITHQVGYDDLKSFRIIFVRNTGLLPLEYRKKLSNPFLKSSE